ncbi:hypothetical protein COB55_03500 [Candidatus Wolfebacteria bacterium]|nr:MAG: hypothetical protein COB55_03500 [Candidatus Wolfebacteria bacterium]
MSIFSDLTRNQNQEPERVSTVGDLIDEKQINYEQVLLNTKDILIDWSRDLLEVKDILDSKDKFFNTTDEDVTLFISKIKGNLFSLDDFGIFDMNNVYDLLNELKTTKECPDPSPFTGTNNTCHVTLRELDDKRSVIRTYNTRLRGYRRDFNKIWSDLLSVRDTNTDDKYTLSTTGSSFNSLTSSVNTINENYSNMRSNEGKLLSTDSSKGLISNISLNDGIIDTKITISSRS